MSKEYFEVSTVRDDESGKAWWTRVGAAFRNKDGSLSVVLDALPVNGKLQIRKPLPRQDSDEKKGSKAAPPTDGNLL